jgi:hypothetical protein
VGQGGGGEAIPSGNFFGPIFRSMSLLFFYLVLVQGAPRWGKLVDGGLGGRLAGRLGGGLGGRLGLRGNWVVSDHLRFSQANDKTSIEHALISNFCVRFPFIDATSGTIVDLEIFNGNRQKWIWRFSMEIALRYLTSYSGAIISY